MALSTITAALYARACFCWYASAHGDALVASTRRSPPRRRRTRHPGDRQGRRSCPKGDPRAQPARYRRARAFSMAASRDETPHSQPAKVQVGAWLSDIGYDPNGLDGLCLLSTRRTPSDASGVLPENQSSEVRALRKGTLLSYRQGYLLPVLPRRRHSGRGFDNSHLLLYFL